MSHRKRSDVNRRITIITQLSKRSLRLRRGSLLQRQWVEDIPVIVSAKEHSSEGILFADKILTQVFAETMNIKEESYYRLAEAPS